VVDTMAIEGRENEAIEATGIGIGTGAKEVTEVTVIGSTSKSALNSV
jgi:hypothetical protein